MKNKRKAAVFSTSGLEEKEAKENLEVRGERRKKGRSVVSKKKKRS